MAGSDPDKAGEPQNPELTRLTSGAAGVSD